MVRPSIHHHHLQTDLNLSVGHGAEVPASQFYEREPFFECNLKSGTFLKQLSTLLTLNARGNIFSKLIFLLFEAGFWQLNAILEISSSATLLTLFIIPHE